MNIKQSLTKYWYISSSVLGVLSGFLVVLVDLVRIDGIIFASGAVFGILSSVYFFFIIPQKLAKWRYFVWIVVSFMSFVVAFFAALYGFRVIHNIAAFGLAGLVGISVLIVAFHFLFLRLSRYYVAILLISGVVIPVIIMPFINFDFYGQTPWDFLLLHILWQTAVVVILGHRIHSSIDGARS